MLGLGPSKGERLGPILSLSGSYPFSSSFYIVEPGTPKLLFFSKLT